MNFDQLDLSPELLRAVHDEGYTEPTPIQEEAIPIVLRGADLMARAQTGTGKTAAFALPILERMKRHANKSFSPARHPIRVLVVAPTRELAIQVQKSFIAYGRHVDLRSTIIYGGVPMPPQEKDLLGGVEIVVATPGRLLDHAGNRTLNLGQVEVLVLDEADRMLDMGFIDDIRRILALLPARRQNLLFSATLSAEVRMVRLVRHAVEGEGYEAERADQRSFEIIHGPVFSQQTMRCLVETDEQSMHEMAAHQNKRRHQPVILNI
jgi:ATP-dependent RNA helicase RhlE